MDNGNEELYWILIRTIRKNTIADDWLTIVFKIPAVHALRHNPAVSREIMWKLRPPVDEADNSFTTAKKKKKKKSRDLHAALISLTVVVQAWFFL